MYRKAQRISLPALLVFCDCSADDAHNQYYIDGGDLQKCYQHHRRQRKSTGEPTELLAYCHLYGGHRNQCHHRRAYAFENSFYNLVVLIAGKDHRYGQDDDKRREYAAQGGHNAALGAQQPIADKYGGVHGHQAGERLRDGHYVHKLVFAHPLALDHQDVAHHRNHGHAAANGECAHLDKGPEQLPITFHRCDFLLWLRK